MIERFNVNLVSLDRLAVLIHGAYGSGKTHLQGDFLRWAKDRGNIAYLNISGEDGFASLAGMGLGNVGINVTSGKQYDDVLAELQNEKLFALAVDSLPAFYKLMLLDIVGEIRYPDASKDGEKARMMWGQLTMRSYARVRASRQAAPFVLWVAPHDKSEDAVGGMGKTITPDLPGKLAHGCAGWFDLVGYLTANVMSSTFVQRKVTFAPSSSILTRQRLPTEISADVIIPPNQGGWLAIYNAINAVLPSQEEPVAKGIATPLVIPPRPYIRQYKGKI